MWPIRNIQHSAAPANTWFSTLLILNLTSAPSDRSEDLDKGGLRSRLFKQKIGMMKKRTTSIDIHHQSHRKTRQAGSVEEMIRIVLAGLSGPRWDRT